MAITRLSKHHRGVFIFLVVLMIASFMIFASPGESPLSCNRSGGAFGYIFGDPVGRDEFSAQYMFNAMFSQERISDAQASMMAYSNLVMQALARRYGVAVADSEVTGSIRANPMFAGKDGRFSLELYRERLRGWRMNAEDFEKQIRNLILSSKLESVLMASVDFTEDEVAKFTDYMTENFAVREAYFKAQDYYDTIEISDEELRQRFESERWRFVNKPRLTAVAVQLKFTDPARIAAAEAVVDDAMVQAFYQANQGRFMDYDTNLLKPFAEVKEIARELCINQTVTRQAAEELWQFSAKIEPLLGVEDPVKRLATFVAVAAENGLSAIETGEFEEGARSTGSIADPLVAQEVAKRTLSSPLTEVITGRDGAYVAALLSYQPETPGVFEEKKGDVRKLCLEEAGVAAARQAAAGVQEKLELLSPDEFVAALDLPANKFGAAAIARRSVFMYWPYGRELSAMIPGELSPVLDTVDGAMLRYVVSRHPATAEEKSQENFLMEYMLRNRKFAASQAALEIYLQQNGCFPPNQGPGR